jgi:hypothetical protein
MSKGLDFCQRGEKFQDGITNGASWYTGMLCFFLLNKSLNFVNKNEIF